jgi:murein L,D-transpeptidase YcbB/YkuD
MKFSISESARIAGVTRKTLYKHIETKPISIEKDENERPVIDASELMRVYGDQCRFDQDRDTRKTPSNTQANIQEYPEGDSADTALVRKELELVRQQMVSEREGLEEQIDYLRRKLDESNSEARKLTALLTDQRGTESRAGEWQKAFQALEERIANKENEAQKQVDDMKRKASAQIARYKKELEAEKSKPLWKKLFAG